MVTVYTAILNGHDNLRPPVATEPGARYVCFSDDPWQEPVAPWELRPAPRYCDDAGRNSRIAKILPHLFFDTDVSIWHDGCFRQVRGLDSLLAYLDGVDLVAIQHPRQNVWAELEYCHRAAKELGFREKLTEDIAAQVHGYSQQGYPGFPFACGGIILRRHCPAIERFNELWWREYQAGQRRDQFSLSYAIWKSGVRYRLIQDVDVLQNPWFGFSFHAAFQGTGNDAFNGVRRQKAEKVARLTELLRSDVAESAVPFETTSDGRTVVNVARLLRQEKVQEAMRAAAKIPCST